MQRIAYGSSFVPCENQRIIRCAGVFVVNKYECFMENKNIKTFSSCKLSKKKNNNIESHHCSTCNKKQGGS